MGFKQLVQDMAEAAFDIIDDLESVTFKYRVSNPTYNKTTGVVTDSAVSYTVDMIISNWNAKQIDNQSILPTDMKAMIPVNDLTVTPNQHCTITYNSVDHDIVNIQTDPMNAIWIFQIRKP